MPNVSATGIRIFWINVQRKASASLNEENTVMYMAYKDVKEAKEENSMEMKAETTGFFVFLGTCTFTEKAP